MLSVEDALARMLSRADPVGVESVDTLVAHAAAECRTDTGDAVFPWEAQFTRGGATGETYRIDLASERQLCVHLASEIGQQRVDVGYTELDPQFAITAHERASDSRLPLSVTATAPSRHELAL